MSSLRWSSLWWCLASSGVPLAVIILSACQCCHFGGASICHMQAPPWPKQFARKVRWACKISTLTTTHQRRLWRNTHGNNLKAPTRPQCCTVYYDCHMIVTSKIVAVLSTLARASLALLTLCSAGYLKDLALSFLFVAGTTMAHTIRKKAALGVQD